MIPVFFFHTALKFFTTTSDIFFAFTSYNDFGVDNRGFLDDSTSLECGFLGTFTDLEWGFLDACTSPECINAAGVRIGGTHTAQELEILQHCK